MTLGQVLHYGLLLTAIIEGIHAQSSGGPEWHVAAGGAGSGSSAAPFGRIQDAINAAQPGDTVTVHSGIYRESIRTMRSGASGAPITLRSSAGRGSVIITHPGRVLTVDHSYVTSSGFILDGQYGADDLVRISGTGHYFHLHNSEIRRSSLDLIDLGAPRGVLIEGCLIHHALNSRRGRTDAHGIVAGAVRDLTVRDSEIHTFSGDGLQLDPDRAAPGWGRVTVERTRIWLAPLSVERNGFPAGAVPGENGIDTKANAALPRSTIVIRDVTASGFRGGLIGNMAAFNLKENVDVTVDGVTVFDSEIAFRLRGAPAGGAWVAVKNAVVFNVQTAFRYEDNIQKLRIWNSTLGSGVIRAFQAASSSSGGLDVRNLLILGALPREARHTSNVLARADSFVNAATHNYELAPGSTPIDAGVALVEVTTDRVETPRPQGAAYDVGAYEWKRAAKGPPGS